MSPQPAPARSVRLRRFVRQLHRWLGLLIAIQVLFWVTGGLIMSALRLDAVRGEDQAAKPTAAVLDPQARVLPATEVLRARQEPIKAATLTTLLDQPVYRLERTEGFSLIDAITGQELSPLPQESARAIALADYAGPGTLEAVEWLEVPELEIRGRDLPLWRARFADARHTTLYVSPATGQIVARRNDLWRVFDFVWMLHIMDYREREDFNHPLLIATAATALAFVLTGLFMLGYSFLPRRA